MALKYLAGGRITGLSTDVKPEIYQTQGVTSQTTQAGSKFIETDSGATYIHNGAGWIQQPFESMHEAFGHGHGVEMGNHVVSWFTGHALEDDQWRINAGTGVTGGMTNAEDGGYTITGTQVGEAMVSYNETNDNNQRMFSNLASCFITVARSRGTNSQISTRSGLKGTNNFTFNGGQLVGWEHKYSNAGYRSFVGAGAAGQYAQIDTGIGSDLLFHFHKGELQKTKYDYSIDGILRTTDTGYLPTIKMAPFLYHYQNEVATDHSDFLYYEAWNTGGGN